MDDNCKLTRKLVPFISGRPVIKTACTPNNEDLAIVERWWNEVYSKIEDEDEPIPIDRLYEMAAQEKGTLTREGVKELNVAYKHFVRKKFFEAASKCAKRPEE